MENGNKNEEIVGVVKAISNKNGGFLIEYETLLESSGKMTTSEVDEMWVNAADGVKSAALNTINKRDKVKFKMLSGTYFSSFEVLNRDTSVETPQKNFSSHSASAYRKGSKTKVAMVHAGDPVELETKMNEMREDKEVVATQIFYDEPGKRWVSFNYYKV